MDSSAGILKGRPYGGLAILWRKNIGKFCKPITYDDDRYMGISITESNKVILIK